MRSEAEKMPSATWRDVPKSVWALGFVSLLMDVSSELIHSLLPVFLVTVIGTSMAVVGLIEGVAEPTAAITKVFSGALSDRIGKRKLLVASVTDWPPSPSRYFLSRARLGKCWRRVSSIA